MKVPGRWLGAMAINFLLIAIVAAQQASNPPFDFPKHVDVPGQKSDDDWYLRMIRNKTRPTGAPTPKPEPRVIMKGPLAPAAVDRKTYAGFLQVNDTGLIKLLPQTFTVDASKIVQNNLNGGNDRYSFSYRLHNYDGELELSSEVVCKGPGGIPANCRFPRTLSAGSYGLLTNLGEVALTSLNANDRRARFMVTYLPSRSQPQAGCEALAFRRGVEIDGQHYQNGLPVKVGSTYLLRAFNYGLSDVLVAFQVVREDRDGSLTIAWKLLRQFTPLKMENVVYVNNPTDKCPIK